MHPSAGGGPPASPQQFCLRWNNYQTNLTNVFDQLLQSESFVDVTLACDGHSVKAHKMVLSACSPYFQALFFENPCQHPIVILKDIKWPELKAVVEFMYKGEINVSQEQIGPLLRVAESLKIRGLADVNGEHDLKGGDDVSLSRHKKRRRTSADQSSSPEGSVTESLEGRALELVTTSPTPTLPPSAPPTPQNTPTPQMLALPPLGPPPPPPPSSSAGANQPEDLEIKPGIAEMIREEERAKKNFIESVSFANEALQRYNLGYDKKGLLAVEEQLKAKMLESSHAWLGASTSSLADSYQYQLQSMWQKCWNTNQSLVHNLRFRERGPLKSWRPETMAEAILSVLKEGLSLSQAARKYDIPYPTFVLYANRVHNMLGPSADGGSDLRPKGRGRPQRILLGIWPEDHIRGVIRAVVFRDPQHMKDENLNVGYHHRLQSPAVQRTPQVGHNLAPQLSARPTPPPYLQSTPSYHSPGYHHDVKPPLVGQDVVHNYSTPGGGSGGGSGPGSIASSDSAAGAVSPNSAAAAVVAVAQNLRQQMLAAAAHHHSQQQQQQQQQQQHQQQQQQMQLHHSSHHHHSQLNHGQHHGGDHHSSQQMQPASGFGFMSAAAAAHCANGNNLVMHSPSPVNCSPRSSPLTQPNNNMEMPMPLGFKPMVNDIAGSRSESMFQDEIEDLVKRPQPSETPGKMKPPSMPYSPMPNDLSMKAEHIFHEEMENMMKRPPVSEAAKVKVGMSVSNMPYKGPSDSSYLNTRPETLFQEDIEDLVKSPPQSQQKEPIHMPVDQCSE